MSQSARSRLFRASHRRMCLSPITSYLLRCFPLELPEDIHHREPKLLCKRGLTNDLSVQESLVAETGVRECAVVSVLSRARPKSSRTALPSASFAVRALASAPKY